MDVQDLPSLNSASLELAIVLDEISGVGYQRATKTKEWRKKKDLEVSRVVIDPASFDKISGFNIFSTTLFPDKRGMDADEVTSPGYSFGSDESLFSTDMEYFDKVGGFGHIFCSEGQVALNQVSRFVDHVAPMLSNRDVSALQSILERLNVKSEEQIIHLKHPDTFANERKYDDADTEIIWITSEASHETDEFKDVETVSFVSDTFSVSEFVSKESSNDLHDSEIIWITGSQELLDAELDHSSDRTVTARTAVPEAIQSTNCDHDFHKEASVVLRKSAESSSDEDESEYIWITSPEREEEPSTNKLIQTSYEDQSKSHEATPPQIASLPTTAASCRLFDFGGEEVIITPLMKKISVPVDVPHLTKEHTAVKPIETSDKDQSASSAKQQDVSSSSDATSRLYDFAGEEVITPLVTGHDEQLDLKISMKGVVQCLNRSEGMHGEYLKSLVTYDSINTEKLPLPSNSFYSEALKNMPSDSSDDMDAELKCTTSGKLDILNSENSARIHPVHVSSGEIHLSSSDHAVNEFSEEESQCLSNQDSAQKGSTSTSAQDSILLDQQPVNSSDSEVRSGLQENAMTVKDSGICSDNLSEVHKDFAKQRDPGAKKFDQNLHFGGRTPDVVSPTIHTNSKKHFTQKTETPTQDDVLKNCMKGKSGFTSLHNQQNPSTVSSHGSKDTISEELYDKFCQMPSEEVFPSTSLLYSSYGSNGKANESSSTDEVKKKKSVHYWMRKIFIPRKFYKKNVKGMR